MYKPYKPTALIISLVMIFSIVLTPFSAVYASAPEINRAISGLKKVETPARVQGVSYELQPQVKKLPSALKYDFKPILLNDFATFDTGNKSLEKPLSGGNRIISPYAGAQDVTMGKENQEAPSFDKINGIKYPPGSKYMVLPKNAASAFTPKQGEIYIDEEEGNALRVLEGGATDAQGNSQYVVETPKLTDIFKSYTIPKQDVKLTTGNIAYVAPGAEVDPRSSMPKNYVASAGGGLIESCIEQNNKHIIKLAPGKMIFQYPSKEDREKTEEEKKKAEKEKFEGDWWAKEQATDLRGFEDESSLSVEVKIKEGTITIEDPTFHADFDLNPLTTRVVADFYFDSKVTSDVTLEGDLKFDKKIEKCIFGYDVDLGKVLGKEKSNKAFVGIFLVLGANGNIHVEVRTITTGNARAGFAYKAYGYGFIPYFVGPYVTYRPSGFDMYFAVDGEIHAVLAAVPQVGVIIWGTEIGALQIWLGFKSDAKFSASGGGGSGTNSSIQSSGSISLNAFGELVGYLFGKRYSIFYKDFPLYKGEWNVGVGVSGGGGDMVYQVVPQFFVEADAYKNTISGKIAFDTSSKAQATYSGNQNNPNSTIKPYASGSFTAEVRNIHTNELRYKIPGATDAEGKFVIYNPSAYNIVPSDIIYIDIPEGPAVKVDNKNYKVVGKSKMIVPTVPFSQLDFNVDTFNDKITGIVSGKYNGPVDITVVNNDSTKIPYTANAKNGAFSLDVPITTDTFGVYAAVKFEGADFPRYGGEYRIPNLDALDIHIYNEYGEQIMPPKQEQNQSGISMPKPDVPKIIIDTNEKLQKAAERVDLEGKKIVRPVKVFGSITNKGDMGWVEAQGDNYVRNSDMNNTSTVLKPFMGTVKITAIPVEEAVRTLLEMVKDQGIPGLTAPQSNTKPWAAATQPKQSVDLRVVQDKNSPSGIRIEQRPVSSVTFEFDEPQAAAYVIEIECDGIKKTEIYNPFIVHGQNTRAPLKDYIGSVQKAVTLATEEKKDAITNPAENVLNQWQGSWMTNIGAMKLIQQGAYISGTINQGGTEYAIEGSISNGVFKGSILIPSEASLFGDIASFEMNISDDGKSINFKNFANSTKLNILSGTKASKQ